MLHFVTVFAAAVVLCSAAPDPTNIFRIDISPEEAQQYLNSPPFNEPQLAGRTAVLPLVRYDSPQFRAAEAGPTLGHYWKNGHEIENTDDYVEEVYDASQFHGQDGLGAFAYGYKTPESSKVENKVRSGEVTGSYTYRDGNNELIKVRYWADSEGFHQEDNLPKIELRPVEEAEDVRQARLAHERAWQEAAAAAAQNPDPQGEYSDKYEYESSASDIRSVSAAVPNQPNQIGREGKAYQSSQQTGQYGQQSGKYGQQSGQYGQQSGQYGQQSGQYGQQSGQYGQQSGKYGQQTGQYGQQSGQYGQQSGQHSQQSAQYSRQTQYQQGGYSQQQSAAHQQGYSNEEPEPTGPPRGFFYSFDYPVSSIVRKDAQGQNGPLNPGEPIDHDTVGVNAQHYG